MWLWLIIIVSLFALPVLLQIAVMFVVAPFILHRRQTLSIQADYQQTRLEDMTPEMRDFLSHSLREFRAAGFEVVANVHQPKPTKNTSSFQVILVDRQRGDTASAIMVHSAGIRAMTFMVRSFFADNTAVTTAASRTLNFLPKDPTVDGVNFPWVTSPTAIVEAHHRRMGASPRAGEVRIVPQPGQEMEWLNRQWAREIERFARCGYTFIDPAAGTCRYTWKGSCLGAWKLAKPIKRIRLRLRERKSRRIWNELGMDKWVPVAVQDDEPAMALPIETTASDAQTVATFVSPANSSPPPTTIDDTNLAYEAALQPGEIRHQFIGDNLIIRMGGISRAQVLLCRWATFLSMFWWIACGSVILFNLWRVRTTLGYIPGAVHSERIWLIVLFVGGFLLVDVFRLVRALMNSRGTVVVTVNHAGLRFRNAPGRTAIGEVPRSQVESLRVVFHEGLFQRIYRLEVRTVGGARPRPLMLGTNKAAMLETVQAIRQAMGLDIARVNPPPLPV